MVYEGSQLKEIQKARNERPQDYSKFERDLLDTIEALREENREAVKAVVSGVGSYYKLREMLEKIIDHKNEADKRYLYIEKAEQLLKGER